MTKAADVFDRVNALVKEGSSKSEAFAKLAEEFSQSTDTVRGFYYREKATREGGGTRSRPRRRETTPDDALADARAALERAIEAIDREVETAKQRADEAKAEHDALKSSATERKQAIRQRIELLKVEAPQ